MRTPDGLLGLVALSLSLALASPASAQTGIDLIENFFGAANVEAITGHGRLSVGLPPCRRARSPRRPRLALATAECT